MRKCYLTVVKNGLFIYIKFKHFTDKYKKLGDNEKTVRYLQKRRCGFVEAETQAILGIGQLAAYFESKVAGCSIRIVRFRLNFHALCVI